ncbi:MAG: sulfite exporter TauE/SafE family protein [Pseudomonadota bacterium]
MIALGALFPDTIAPHIGFILVGASFLTSAISGAFGMGGGVTLLALMGLFLPVPALIPVHGMVQLGSNAGRAWQLKSDIAWRRLTPFFVFGVAGALVGAMLVVELPDAILKTVLGLFVIVIMWVKLPPVAAKSNVSMAIGGFVTNVLTMFLGATGPLVIALFSRQFGVKEVAVASAAVGMMFQHFVKVIAFGVLGFAFSEWIPLIIAMVISGYAGTVAGVKLLKRFPEERFRFWFRIGMTVLGADLVRRGLMAL